ncbi:MAG: hypothetical protein QM736_20905 [Vicinamibacterales bacterium]
MPTSRLVLMLIDRAESCGIREDILGDLVEEMDRGRSHAWICRQLLGLCGWTMAGRLRARASTPQGVAFTMVAAWLAAASIAPIGRVIQAWLVIYYFLGVLSLFAHLTSEQPSDHGDPDRDRAAEW